MFFPLYIQNTMVADSYGEGLDLFGNVERRECINRVEEKVTKSGKIQEVERAVGAGSPERAVVRPGEERLPVSKRHVHRVLPVCTPDGSGCHCLKPGPGQDGLGVTIPGEHWGNGWNRTRILVLLLQAADPRQGT